MPKLPKLRLKMPHGEQVRDLEEIKEFIATWGMFFLVDGQVIKSYEELVKLAEKNMDSEFLEVMVVPFVQGG